MKRKLQSHLKNIFSTRNICMMAMLVALQIVLARYVGFYVSETNRVAPLETVPLALAGIWLGPVGGMIVALVSDILGTIIAGYGTYFPPITLGPMFFAAFCGICTKYIFRSSLSETQDAWKVALIVIVAGLINGFVIGPVTTTWYQILVMNRQDAFRVLWGINMVSRGWTKPALILTNTIGTVVVNRAAYKSVVRPILGKVV